MPGTKAPIPETGWSGSPPPNREAPPEQETGPINAEGRARRETAAPALFLRIGRGLYKRCGAPAPRPPQERGSKDRDALLKGDLGEELIVAGGMGDISLYLGSGGVDGVRLPEPDPRAGVPDQRLGLLVIS